MAIKPPVRIEDMAPAGGLDGTEIYEATKNGVSVKILGSQLFALGKSAYQVAVQQGFVGDVTAWLLSLKGAQGNQGLQGLQGLKGDKGDKGDQGLEGQRGLQGLQGLSAYQLAVGQGYPGTEAQWLASLIGAQGKSAYQLATESGFVGTQVAWLASLVGAKGDKGDTGDAGVAGQSAYQLAVTAGFAGTLQQWLDSLVGASGKTVRNGAGVPGAGLGVDGDFYIDTTAKFIYGPKTAGAWGAGTSIVGAQGNQGTNGTNGTDGSKWLTGAGVPAAGLGVVNDYYIDTTTTQYYQKTDAVTWTLRGVLSAASRQAVEIACSDESTALSTGITKVSFRMRYGFKLSSVKASLGTAQTSGTLVGVDVKVNGVSIFATPLTFNNTSKTSVGATTPYVFSAAFIAANYVIADDAEVTIDILQLGDGTAKGLKVYLVGEDSTRAGTLVLVGTQSPTLWKAAQTVQPVIAGAVSVTYTADASLSNNFQLTMVGNTTIANPTNLTQGQVLNFCVDQDATGGRTITLGSLFKWPGGVVPSWVTTANAKNFFSAYYDGNILRCGGGAGYA